MARKLELSGWGRFPVAEGLAERPERIRTLEQVASSGNVIARGLGRSYGDAAFTSQGTTILMERLNRMLAFDEGTGVLTCEAGVSLDDIISTLAPRGFFPPVVPGTRFVTVGGAIACDIHGKNHHRDGAFSRHVLSLRLLTAAGSVMECSRERNSEAFWATIGGMGLTGIIVDATFRLKKIKGSLVMDQRRARNLDEALKLFEEDEKYEYTVAWIDCLAKGKHLGRSVLMRASEGPPFRFHERSKQLFSLPKFTPNVLTKPFVRSFNAAYYASHRDFSGKHPDWNSFFFPLDAVANCNRAYGSRGFIQYQFVVPESRPDAIRAAIEEMNAASFLAVLKRFGEGEAGQRLSFPMRGYTLAVDFPATEEVFAMCKRLDELVIGAGGRVYLAKDSRLSADALREMYPSLKQWSDTRSALDPERRFASDMAKRLELQ